MAKAQENAAFFAKFKPGYCTYVGPGGEAMGFSKVQHRPNETWDALATKFFQVYEEHNFLVLRGNHLPQRRCQNALQSVR